MPKKLTAAKLKDLQWDDRPKKSTRDPLPEWTTEIDEVLNEIQAAKQVSAIMTIRQPYAEKFRKNRDEVEGAILNQPEESSINVTKLYFAQLHKPEYD